MTLRAAKTSLIFTFSCVVFVFISAVAAQAATTCSANVASSFAQHVVPGEPFQGALCFQPNYFTFTSSARATVHISTTLSSANTLPSDSVLLSHQLLKSNFEPLFPNKRGVIGAQSYQLDAGLFTRLFFSFFFLPFFLFLFVC